MIIKNKRFAVGIVTLSIGVLASLLDGGRSRTKCRQLSTTAGIASIALLTILFPLGVLSTAAWADTGLGQMHFTVVAVSDAAVREGTQHRMALNGDGKFGPEHVKGGGTFVIFNDAPTGTPKPILGFGRWRAEKILSYAAAGTYGPIVASVLELEVELIIEFPAPEVASATLRLVCNVDPAGLTTGEPEGFKLTIQNSGEVFVPSVPVVGFTQITNNKPGRNRDHE